MCHKLNLIIILLKEGENISRDARSRKWQVTINNPADKSLQRDELLEILSSFNGLIYYCLSDEVGENSTYHTHIYIVSNNAIRFSTMKKRFKKAHLEIARGSSIENRDYIFKLGKWKNHKKTRQTYLKHIMNGEKSQ